MMRLRRTPWPLASWSFERRAVLIVDFNESDLIAVAKLAGEALIVLAEHRLLLPEQVTLEAWADPQPGGVARRTDLPPTQVPMSADTVETAVSWLGEVLRRESAARGGRYPLDVLVIGKGLIEDDKAQPRTVPDVVRLGVYTMGFIAAQVSTDLDIWLPYDLRAVPQQALSARNAPRLRAALHRLGGLEGVSVAPVEVTDYAAVFGYEVRNHVDAHRNVVPVLDEDVLEQDV